nr:acyl-CoA carboxylase subunit beta [Oceanococcus sp. HetDA_MAG_MS8]
MAVIESKVDSHSPEFAQNQEDMLACIAEFRAVEEKVRASEESKRERFRSRQQLMPRERVARLLDRGSPFLELSTLCGYKEHDDKDGSLAGGNLIGGIGYVSGVRCLITASNSAIKGGTMSPWGVQKTLRLQEIALANKLPVVALIESGGANLPYQHEMFIQGGKTFCNQARLSAAGIPQVTIVHGSSTAGGAYMPGLSDVTIMVRDNAKVFLAGPPLLKAATGEIADDEELGGAEMHATVAGTCEFTASDDAQAIRIAREVMQKLGWNSNQTLPGGRDFAPPQYPIEDLLGVVPADYRQPYDCRELIARLVDDSDFTEFKAEFDQQTICGQASIEGWPVGLIGNNGPITTKGANKAGQFIQLCCQLNMPIVYLQNITGYMVGTESERGGIVKHGSKMIQAVANASVPQITLVVGGSFGAGNYGMCGRGFDPDFIFAWPNSRTAVMGGEQAGKVLSIVTEAKMKKSGQEVSTEFLEQMQAKIEAMFAENSHPFKVSGRLWDDGIIDPRDSRRVLALCLAICREREHRKVQTNSFGVARL